MTSLRILSTLAVMGAMKEIAEAYQAAAIEAEFSPTVALLERLRGGEAADIAILTAGGIDDLINEGIARPGTRTDMALSRVGVAVKAGAPKPDIGTVAAFRAALLAAGSVAYSRIGASGIYFAGLIERMGIADQVNAKATIVASGFTAELAASGAVELAVQQISELMVVPGIEVAGPLPPEVQTVATFSAGMLARSEKPAEAAAMLRFLASPDIAPVLRRTGLEPVGPAAAGDAMPVLTVIHRTSYRYASPVTFGEHRMMMRPRDSHDLRLLETALLVRPAASIRWIHDVFGNSIAIAKFSEPANELFVQSTFRAEHFPLAEGAVEIEEYARRYPFSYDASEAPDIGRTAERHYPDPGHRIDLWARRFVEKTPGHATLGILARMTKAIKAEFRYNPRDEMGTQDPVATLVTAAGTCRDYALLMMEAARSLGFAARFVSGYLYDDSKIRGGAETVIGGGVTHAWAQIYLPGAGWVPFDPTNGLISDRNLIRVAVTRDPSQAVPLKGSFTGKPLDFLGMDVSVEIRA
jgi:transglutaminase-like putative cysteine protease/ABC-type molybdate transport system substrate-binding protein